jgi:hypothetical protein
VAWLAWRRLRRRDSGAIVAALGLTVAAAILAAVFAGVTIAADRATADAVERIPTAGSTARAIWFGVPAGADEREDVLDGGVRDALSGLPLPGPTELVLFREATVAGHFVGLAAVDGLAPYVELRSGRLPRPCTPERCEVLRLRGEGKLPNAPGLRLVEVGTAKLVSRRLLGDFLGANDDANADAELGASLGGRYHEPDPAPLVIAEGVDTLAESPALSRLYRSYAWVWPIEPGRPRLWEIDSLLSRLERARASLARTSSAFAVSAPEEELSAAERKAEIGARRLLLVGGEAAALLLAFALLAARTLRRDLRAAHARLTWYGARRWQLGLLTGVESGLVALGGVLLGWLAGTVVGAIAAALAGAPAREVLRESTLSATGLLLAAGAALVTGGLVTLVVSLRAREGSRFGVPEALAAGALLVSGVALLDGGLDEERLARGGSSVVLLLLVPGLVALVGAVLVARVVPVAARFVADRRRGSTSVRLAALGLTRGAGAAAVTAAFLTIAFALSLLAEGYRATLTRGERESAAFQVPLDVAVREDPGSLVRVFDAAPLARYRELAGPEGDAYPVLRVSASAGRAARVTGVTVLGVDRPVLERLRVWRNQWAGGRDRAETASLVEPGGQVALRSAALPDGEIVVTVGPERIGLAAIVEAPGGEFRRVDLGSASTSATRTLRARAPRGSRLVSLELVPPPRLIEGGANAGIAYEGSVRLGGPLARELRAWIGVDGAEATPAGAGVDVDFTLTLQRTTRLRARQATDAVPPAVLVTPALAELAGGVGGDLPLRVGGSVATARVAGVIERFPGAEGDVVVGDRGALRTALDTAVPGSARENEVWLDLGGDSADAVRRAFAERPLDILSSTLRTDLEAEVAADPIARGTLVALGAAALLALVLAAIGLGLAVRSELRDERGELYELEALGASPSLLRTVVRLRALGVSLAGLAAGVLTGIVLVALVTRIVSVTAQGGFAEPPLVATVHVGVLVAGLGVFAALGALLVGASTRRAFSSPRGPLVLRGDD